MAESTTYYLNADTLVLATAVFVDEALSMVASDGYYKQDTIVRQQLDGILMPKVTCPSCS